MDSSAQQLHISAASAEELSAGLRQLTLFWHNNYFFPHDRGYYQSQLLLSELAESWLNFCWQISSPISWSGNQDKHANICSQFSPLTSHMSVVQQAPFVDHVITHLRQRLRDQDGLNNSNWSSQRWVAPVLPAPALGASLFPPISPNVQTLWNPVIYSTSPLDKYYPSQTSCVWDRTPCFTLQICSIQRDFPFQLMAAPFCQWLSPKILVSLKPSQLENHTDSTFTIFPQSNHFWAPPLPHAGWGYHQIYWSCNWLCPCVFHNLFSTDNQNNALKYYPVCLSSAQNPPVASCFTQSKRLWPHRSLKGTSWSDPY